MSSITVTEIKQILQLDDSWSERESVTFSSLAWKRLTYKPIVSIERVNTDTNYTTASAYDSLDYETTTDYRNYTLINRIDTGGIGDTETVYVSYSYGQYDDLIKILLPQVEYDVCDYLNNWFMDTQTEYASDFKLVARSGSSHPQIKDTINQEFLRWGFESDMDITVTGTPRNAGIYHISSATAGVIKLSSGDTLLAESSTVEFGGNVIQINRIKWPPAVKRIIAYIIWHNIVRAKDQAIQSKSLGPSSVTYAPLSSGGYPPSIMDALNKFKYVKTL